MVKNPPAMIPGSGRYPGEGHGNPLQYSCLENPTDTGAWWATVHGVAKDQTRLKRLGTHTWIGSWWVGGEGRPSSTADGAAVGGGCLGVAGKRLTQCWLGGEGIVWEKAAELDVCQG